MMEWWNDGWALRGGSNCPFHQSFHHSIPNIPSFQHSIPYSIPNSIPYNQDMFTIFAIPKAFRGHTGVIQRNAIRSWTRLQPPPEILLFGNDEGAVEYAAELGIRSIPEVRRNELGTPFISDIFRASQQRSSNDILVYCNSDIILMQDFADAVRRLHLPRFIAAGQRWDLDITELLNFQDGWSDALRLRIERERVLHSPEGMDYFVFTRGLLADMPEFLVGRPAWDNWIVFHARQASIPLIDMTEAVTVVHQNHDYSHIKHRDGPLWEGPEARQNRSVLNTNYNFTIEDATHRLNASGLHHEWRYSRWKRNLDVWSILHPGLAPWISYPRRIVSRLLLQPLRRLAQPRQ